MIQKNNSVSQKNYFVKHMYKYCIVTIIVILSTVYLSYSKNKYLEIHFLDVGQGDSILIKSPDNLYMLVDAGETSAVIEQIDRFIPVNKRKIDYIILTHPDNDHVGGMSEVLKRYEVDYVFYNDFESSSQPFTSFKKIIQEQNITSRSIDDLSDFWFGCCVWIDVLWPEAGAPLETEANNISTTFQLNYDNFDLFLAGDLEAQFEDRIVAKGNFESDIMKISHHGSKTSTSDFLLSALKPQIAVISVGENNKYSHPSLEVIERLEEHEISYYMTSKDSTISFLTDGYHLHFK